MASVGTASNPGTKSTMGFPPSSREGSRSFSPARRRASCSRPIRACLDTIAPPGNLRFFAAHRACVVSCRKPRRNSRQTPRWFRQNQCSSRFRNVLHSDRSADHRHTRRKPSHSESPIRVPRHRCLPRRSLRRRTDKFNRSTLSSDAGQPKCVEQKS